MIDLWWRWWLRSEFGWYWYRWIIYNTGKSNSSIYLRFAFSIAIWTSQMKDGPWDKFIGTGQKKLAKMMDYKPAMNHGCFQRYVVFNPKRWNDDPNWLMVQKGGSTTNHCWVCSWGTQISLHFLDKSPGQHLDCSDHSCCRLASPGHLCWLNSQFLQKLTSFQVSNSPIWSYS